MDLGPATDLVVKFRQPRLLHDLARPQITREKSDKHCEKQYTLSTGHQVFDSQVPQCVRPGCETNTDDLPVLPSDGRPVSSSPPVDLPRV